VVRGGQRQHYPLVDQGKVEQLQKLRIVPLGRFETEFVATQVNLQHRGQVVDLAGDAGTALDDPWSLVITAESANKYFGDTDPLGEIININSEYNFTVTAVVDDPPDNSSIRFDFLVNFTFLEKLGYSLDDFEGNPFFTYLELEDPGKAADLETPICDFLDEHQSEDFTVDQSLLPLKDFQCSFDVIPIDFNFQNLSPTFL